MVDSKLNDIVIIMVSGRWAIYQPQPGKDATCCSGNDYHTFIFLLLQSNRFLPEKTLSPPIITFNLNLSTPLHYVN